MSLLAPGGVEEETDRDPEDQRSSRELEVGKAEELRGVESQHDAEDGGAAGSDCDSQATLVGWERLDRHRDHDGIVAGEQDIDQDYRKYAEEKFRAEISHR